METIEKLRELLAKATPGPWELQDGCSWRRIGSRCDGDVLHPSVERDGYPDLSARDGRLYPNLNLIVAAVNALPTLLDELERLQKENGEMRKALQSTERWLNQIAEIDINDIVADGGVTAGMVVQQEARLFASRAQRWKAASASFTARQPHRRSQRPRAPGRDDAAPRP